MINQKQLWQLFLITLTITMCGIMMKHALVAIKYTALIMTSALVVAAYVEYRCRKLASKLRRQAEARLEKQAERFHGHLWLIIHGKPWGGDELGVLMDLQGEFNQIRTSSKYGKTNPEKFLWKESS